MDEAKGAQLAPTLVDEDTTRMHMNETLHIDAKVTLQKPYPSSLKH